MININYSTIRNMNKRSLLGLTDPRTNKPYVVGFQKHHLAKRLTNWLPPEPVLRIKRRAVDNLTGDFNDALAGVGLEQFAVDKLTVDYDAQLLITKRKKGDIDDVQDIFQTFNIKGSDFMLYPFERSVGLIIPLNCSKETREAFVYNAMVIDPCFNANLFKSSLQ